MPQTGTNPLRERARIGRVTADKSLATVPSPRGSRPAGDGNLTADDGNLTADSSLAAVPQCLCNQA